MRTWNSTFQRRSEPVCFIQSSRLPSSVTTGIDLHGDWLAFGEAFDRRQRDLDAAGFFEFALRIGDDLAGRVAASHLGGEEAEIGRLTGHQSKFAVPRSAIHSLPPCPEERCKGP